MKKILKTLANVDWITTSSFGCGKEYSAMKGSNICTPLNKIKYNSLKQVQIEPYIISIVFKEIVTKYDLNGPNIDSLFIIKILISNFI